MNSFIICLSLITVLSTGAQGEVLRFQSAIESTPLLELYTSEGCSSCPPAESWLSRLKDSPGLWKDFVPVAFHVDYWDRLGWSDPWAAREFSDRQRAYAQHWRSESVYTPGFVLNGKEWRDWGGQKDGLKPSGLKPGILAVVSSDTNRWHVNFAPAYPDKTRYEVHAALLGCGLNSDVKAGENQGHHLKHDFAVLTLVKAFLENKDGLAEGDFVLPLMMKTAEGRFAMAVWITQGGRLEPLQATGGWLDKAVSQ